MLKIVRAHQSGACKTNTINTKSTRRRVGAHEENRHSCVCFRTYVANYKNCITISIVNIPDEDNFIVGKFELADGHIVEAYNEQTFWAYMAFVGRTGLQFAQLVTLPGCLRVNRANPATWQLEDSGEAQQMFTDRNMPEDRLEVQLLMAREGESGAEYFPEPATYRFVDDY